MTIYILKMFLLALILPLYLFEDWQCSPRLPGLDCQKPDILHAKDLVLYRAQNSLVQFRSPITRTRFLQNDWAPESPQIHAAFPGPLPYVQFQRHKVSSDSESACANILLSSSNARRRALGPGFSKSPERPGPFDIVPVYNRQTHSGIRQRWPTPIRHHTHLPGAANNADADTDHKKSA